MYPDDLNYTKEHEWVRDLGNGIVRFGITEFAADALGDIVFVSLPGLGEAIAGGQPCGEVESTKSVSDIYAPLSGTVVSVNEALEDSPELVNQDPYGQGWMVEVQVSKPEDLSDLLDALSYEDLVSAE